MIPPKEKAKELFNKIRYMDNKNGNNCTTCDCVVMPIAKFICDEFISFMTDELKWDVKTNGNIHHWQEVKAEIEKQ